MDDKAPRPKGKLITQRGHMSVTLLSTTNGIIKSGHNNGYPERPITEIITNGFFTVDRKWTVKYWNKGAETLLGVSAKDIVGKNLWKEFAGIIPVGFYAIYHKAFVQDTPIHFEEYWGEMGAWFDIVTYCYDDTLSVSFKNQNQLTHLVQADQQLKALNELYRLVTEVTNDCLWEWDLINREMFWIDGGHKRVFGYQIENALIPQSFWENRLHHDDRARVLASLNQAISKKSASLWEIEYRFKKSDGSFADVHDRGHIIYDAKSRACRMIGATEDITARKLAERKLLESEAKLSLIAKQMMNAVIITDAEDNIAWVNSAFTRITEYKPEEVMGKKPGSFLQGEETDPLTAEYLNKKIQNKQAFDCEIINYSKSGRRYWMHVHGQPLFDKEGVFEQFFSIRTDITEKVLLEKKLMQERLASQKEITAAVLTAQEKERADIGRELHDNLNQILAVAKLYMQMAKTYVEKRDIHIDKSCRLLEDVMEEIRKIAKTLVLPATHIIGLFDNIKNLVRDLEMIDPIRIEFYHDNINEEELNEKLQVTIFRIVQEQIKNILTHAGATYAAINLSKEREELVLSFSDNGKGCDTSKGKSGVGIINIRSRAELYDGNVTIVSKPDEGYKLKVVMPLSSLI